MQARQVFSAYLRGPAEEHPWRYCPSCSKPLERCEDPESAMRCVDPSCRSIHFRNPVPIVAIMVVSGNRVLLCKRRAGTLNEGEWCLPCGYIEFDEDFLTAGRREVKEETGLDVAITSILSVASNFLRSDLHTLAVALLATPTGGLMQAGSDVDDVAWFTVGDPLPKLAFSADSHMIERYFATRLPGAPVDPLYSGSAS
ncbi:NUDIX hydrolase [Bradyrhizobium sp. 170]|uniref:nucleotide triphosphate diphosphatase NUDT15 n=1 Tax=Bradyrhizobium sp. 170 TaxID=2782641 RepID=UPI001FFF2C31|nr:NUDIX hydrolase [Bradyrhizobium sp. 170]UPK00873.1 NUDIX domain-containing protein [Bradyrhizobium sp. 170]